MPGLKITQTFFLWTIVLLIPVVTFSQKPVRNVSTFPFPIIYYTPETRWAYGLAGNATFNLPVDSFQKRTSSILAGIAGTQNKQFLLYTQFTVFYKKFYISGEAGYYKYNYFFYGNGKKEVPEELYGVNYPRIRLNMAYRIMPGLYTGIGYQYEKYQIKNTAPGGALSQGLFPGSNGSIVSGAGIQAVYDTRDTVLFPSRGYFINAGAIVNGKYLGGNFNFVKYILDASAYKRLSPGLLIAFNSYNSFISGNAPFQQLSQLGGNKIMRGYYQGRYADKNLSALQAELRLKIYRRLGASIFTGGSVLGSRQPFLDFSRIHTNYGGGLRINLNRREHFNLRLDYAIGQGTSGFYLSFGEAF